MRRTALVTLLLIACAAPIAQGDEGPEDNECMVCHGSAEELRAARTDPDRDIAPLLFYWAAYKRSVHADTDCTDCHQEYDTFPHSGEDVQTLSCAECHEEAGELHAKGVHGRRVEGAGTPTASCIDCHGTHEVYRPDVRESRLHPLNVHLTCGKCHFEHATPSGTRDQLLQEKLLSDVHGHAIVHQGLTVSATCVSCHGGHGILPVGDPESRVGRKRVHETCATCHLGVIEHYKTSVHYKPNGAGEQEGASCTDCHRPHHIGVRNADFRTEIVETCGGCHKEQADTFHETFHGKSASLGFGENVATCSSCHGSHRIFPSADPQSMTHETQLVQTCAQCHPHAHAAFARYDVHADPTDAERYPGLHFVYTAMTALLIGVFLFAGIHSVLFLTRSIAAGDWRRSPIDRTPGSHVRRWPVFYSFLHVVMMISFLLLGVTGLPLHYHEQGWARSLMSGLGGPQVTSVLHRFGGILMLLAIAAYLFDLFVIRMGKRRERGLWTGPNTMLPRAQDFRDLWANLKWFFFLGPRPKLDRWTYWEKFDFWAVFWGIAVIGGSGLIMWLPEATTLVLPAWAINVAVIVHGHEALLAIGFIFTVHIFHTQLRPEKFPGDILFLTGRMSIEELKHERPKEYERLVASGELEAIRTNHPRRGIRAAGVIMALTALVVGVTLVGLMLGAWMGA